MDLYNLFTIIAAAFSGATMGSFLLVTLLYKSHIKAKKNITNSLFIYRRLYRLNTALCLMAGVSAALVKNQTAALLLAILAASYVFNHSHLLKGMVKTCNQHYEIVNWRAFHSLNNVQNCLHLCQLGATGYAIYLLSLS